MSFFIEQIAIAVPDPDKAIELLTKLGAHDWVRDIVVARGRVKFKDGEQTNVAQLNFNYQLGQSKPLEFEVLDYQLGANWIESSKPTVSHLGMHCTPTALIEYKQFFKSEGIGIAQEVRTESHSNPAIAGKRQYHYCIFDTRKILGVDLKFIVRKDVL